MRLELLKRIRVAVSLFFFLATGLLFLDYTHTIPPVWFQYILFLQFVPSLMRFISVASVTAIGFVIVLAVSLLWGRLYCSSICPLGTFQDVASFLAQKTRLRKYHNFVRAWNWIRYPVAAAVVISAFMGSLVLLNLLEPFSSFGRILSNIVKPVLLTINNAAADVLLKIGIYSIYPVEFGEITVPAAVLTASVLIGLLWMALRHGRLYCNTICPVGTLLGFISRFSAYQVSIDKDACIGCKLCEQACKGGCIDRKNKTVDVTRCVGCFNCFAVCPVEGVMFQLSFPKSTKQGLPGRNGGLATGRQDNQHQRPVRRNATSAGRRDMLLKSLLVFTGAKTIGKKQPVSTRLSTVRENRSAPVSPPGSIQIEHFHTKCTACHLCVSTCPSRVLTPSFLEYGLDGIMQPRMDYSNGFCNFECMKCAEVCPSGALVRLPLDEKKLTQLGVARFIKDNCIVYTEKTECGACSEHCPTKAVNMVPFEHLVIPEVKQEYCIGCGACEHACPTHPYKAIVVDGKQIHTIARKPDLKKLDQPADEGFPF